MLIKSGVYLAVFLKRGVKWGGAGRRGGRLELGTKEDDRARERFAAAPGPCASPRSPSFCEAPFCSRGSRGAQRWLPPQVIVW